MFAPIAFENLGVPSASARQLLSDLGRRLTDISGESRETCYLVQRFNAVLLHDSLPDRDCRITRHTELFVVFLIFKPPSGIDAEGKNNNINNNNVTMNSKAP